MTPSTPDRDYQVFISHHSGDQAIAEAISELLDETFSGHLQPFISSRIAMGSNWLQEVKDALQSSAEVLTVFTHRSAERPWVNIETGHAVMSGRPVTPLLFDGLRAEDLSAFYRLQQVVDEPSDAAIARLFDSISTRLAERFTRARDRAKFDRDEFLVEWRARVSAAERRSPKRASGPVTEPVLWIIGSHDKLTQREQDECLGAIQVVARMAFARRFRLVLGTSRLLDYLADAHEKIADDELANAPGHRSRKALAAAHTVARKPAHHPVVLVGNLRTPDIRRRFHDALGRVPHLAIVIGGGSRTAGGRTHDERDAAAGADIPVLPIRFTGGAAAEVQPSLNAAAMQLFAGLEATQGRQDAFQDLLERIIEAELGLSEA